MSDASARPAVSTRKPLAALPSSSSIVPIPSGDGMAATKRPKASGRAARPRRRSAAIPWRRGSGRAWARTGRQARRVGRQATSSLPGEKRAPSSRSWPLSGMPDRCAPTTTRSIVSSGAPSPGSAPPGSAQPVAPSVKPLAAWMSRASAAVSQSLPAGASKVTLIGSPSSRLPVGTAMPHMSSRLTKLV